MKSQRLDRRELIDAVKSRIERAYPDSVVIWTGTGYPDDEYDETENLEALWIRKEEYAGFQDFVWDLEKELADPGGFSIMVHALSPEVTSEYRSREYEEGMSERRRLIEIELVPVAWWSRGSRTRRSNGNNQKWDSRHSPDLRPRIPEANTPNVGLAA